MTTMRAYRVVDWERPAELVEVRRPDPGAGQVRIRVAGCGLCHSDLVMTALTREMGVAIGWQVPFTLGHETAGWVDGVGDGVEGFHDGEAVALVSPSSCGRCRWCRRGQENACPDGLVGRGYGRDGGLADWVVVDEPQRSLLRLGTFDPAVAGPLTDAGATSYHAVRRALPFVGPDATCIVIGVGGLGAFVVQFLRALTDARLVVIDPDPVRRQVGLDLGAHHALDGVDDTTRRALRSVVGTDPIDAVLDVVGADATIDFGLGAISPGGVLGVVGAAGGRGSQPWFRGGLPRDGAAFTFQGSDIADARAVVDLAAQGRLRVDVAPYSLDDVVEAYGALDRGGLAGRIVVRP